METFSNVFRMLQAGLGIGLVIFVHELGHFLAARRCGVRVDVFSLGFGPRVLGFRRGPTMYQLALVPFGGYVRMAGEEGPSADREPRGDELWTKSVGQRFFIYSGGVLMNFLFALVVFPIIFAVGVPFMEPVLGTPVPGGPAWHAGIQGGTRVLSVDDEEVLDYTHVVNEVALGDPSGVRMKVLEPGSTEPREIVLVPEYDEASGFPRILVSPPLDFERRIAVREGGAAWDAGIRTNDRLLAVEGVSLAGVDPVALLDYAKERSWREGAPLRLRVATDEGERIVELEARPAEETAPPRLGILGLFNWVADVRATELVKELGIREDDRILRIGEEPVLRRWDVNRALSAHVSGEPVRITVARGGRELLLESEPVDRAAAIALAGDLAIGQDIDGTTVAVNPGEPGYEAGLRTGDRILTIDDEPMQGWREVQSALGQAGRENRAVSILVERPDATPEDGPSQVLVEDALPAPQPIYDFGVDYLSAQYVYKANGPLDAIVVGATCSVRFLEDTWLTLRRMIFGQVSSKTMGGIITIGKVSYILAEAGWTKLVFFLCLLSITLAFLNVLPIPVLDGGHLLFLVIEKLKGTPVSERVLGYSQMVGLVLLLSLMVYVTYNDLVHWVFPD